MLVLGDFSVSVDEVASSLTKDLVMPMETLGLSQFVLIPRIKQATLSLFPVVSSLQNPTVHLNIPRLEENLHVYSVLDK